MKNRPLATLLATAALATASIASPASAADAKANSKPTVTRTTRSAPAKKVTTPSSTKLPRQWVWKKQVKRFDTMFRK